MSTKQKIKKLADKLPWWLLWVVNLIQAVPLIDEIVKNPEILAGLLAHWSIPAPFITLIVTAFIAAFKDSPAKD